MSNRRGFPWWVGLGLGLGLVLIVIAAFVLKQAEQSRSNLPVLGQVPQFSFTERSGQPFGLQDMLGQVCVVDFFFTRCQGVCPVMVISMSKLYKAFGENDRVRFVSISVDPEYDTPEVLRRYALDHGVTDDRWVFLNAPVAEVIALSEKGFMLPAEELPMGHSSRFVLVDQQGRIRGYYAHNSDQDQKLLKTHILQLLKSKS